MHVTEPVPAQALHAHETISWRFSTGLPRSRAPDASFAEFRALYEDDERLRVPTTVFNAVLNRLDASAA